MTDASATRKASVPWQNARIVRIVRQTSRIKSFFFAPPHPFQHLAGQHVDLRLTAPDGYSAVRSYSIASAPGSSGEIELAVERLDDGEVSPFLHEVAEVGDEIELRGPLGGHFIWTAADGGPLLLIGGGSGLVPLMAMIRYRRSIGSDVPTLLLLSSRTWEDVLYRDELLELDSSGDGFSLMLTLTRGVSARSGDYSRRIDAAMIEEALARLPVAPRHVFICGSNPFVNTAADASLAAGLAAPIIRTERYGT
ncbi:ferredoxin reductase [Chelativorans sp. J32]|uniref:ferredoxin reductase n=1 Tax=Chelativorans sp. J32 TaxID=935840 RepID=UPI0004875856|nr:ferredoxin reductase [Chelativorans sp. J32]